MADDVWNKIIRDIQAMGYRNQVGLYLHHEPLLERTLFEKIRHINEETEAFAVISTNGFLLNEKKRRLLIDAKPRIVHININSAEKDQYEKMTGLSFETTIGQTQHFIAEAAGMVHVEINCPVLPGVDVEKLISIFPGVQVNADYWANSRGGLLEGISSTGKESRFKISDYCLQPVQNFNILFDGSVIVCCNDWAHESKNDFPNVMDRSISEIYSGDRMKRIIDEFQTGNYGRYRMCRHCAVEMGFVKAGHTASGSFLPAKTIKTRRPHAEAPLSVLLATNHLLAYTGSEITLFTLAKILKEKGHSVSVFAKYIDTHFISIFDGIACVFNDVHKLAGLRFDAAYVQHHPIALELRYHFPDLPICLASLGVLPFLEQPPLVGLNISRYLAISEEVRENLIQNNVDASRIEIFRNIVDSRKFRPTRPIHSRPRTAVVYSYKIDPANLNIILQACEALDIQCRRMGEKPGAIDQNSVSEEINRADIVFTLGRGVIETMMCGKIPIVFDYQGGDGMVTPENIRDLMTHNFSGRRYRRSYQTAEMIKEIERYNPKNAAKLRDLAVELFDADRGIDRLVTWLKTASIKSSPDDVAARNGAIRSLVQLINTTKEFSEATFARNQGVPSFQKTAPLKTETAPAARPTTLRSSQGSHSKLIAFYLPQYHPIRENDEWWGKGFTEWTNVAKSAPLFPGHYQPHLPGELGFYDLRLPEVRKAQAELARQYGIYGFCYYHYWFNGKRLLDRPLKEVLASGEPDFPFCLCWANENWTRVWDGGEDQILMEQKYSDEDDLAHIRHLCEIFRDSRYIRIGGRPLFLVYRANRLPDPCKTTATWREEARRTGVGELYLCRVESFPDEHTDPKTMGFDAAVEFQPDWALLSDDLRDDRLPGLAAFRYDKIVDRMLQKEDPPYKRFRCVTPSWDNTPRRKRNALLFTESSPAQYGRWLRGVLEKSANRGEEKNLAFINAWNEWGEGNHLEPDERFGRAYLEATKSALDSTRRSESIQAAEAHEGILKLFVSAGKRAEAIFALEKLAESFPEYAPARNDLGVLYGETGNLDKALAAYEKAAFLDPGNATFQKNLGDFHYVAMKRPDAAVRHYEKALSLNPRDTETLLILGNIQVESGSFREARDCYLRVLEMDPSNDLAGKMFKAIEARARQTAAADPESLYREARSLVQKGQTDRAIEKLELMLQACPDHAMAHNDLGILCFGRGNRKKSLAHFEKAVAADRTNPTALKNLADLYFADSGRTEEALKLYNEVLARNPDDVETLAALGSVCITLGRLEDAVPFYERILRAEPDNGTAKEILEKLGRQKGADPAGDSNSNRMSGTPGSGPGPSEGGRVVDARPAGLVCLQPFYMMEFTTSGHAYTCCPAWTKLSIGHIGKATIDEIWNSEQARLLRRKILTGRFQDVCNEICPHIAEHRHTGKLIPLSELDRMDTLTPELAEEIRSGHDRLESPPTVFNLSNSTVCNLSCIMCSRHTDASDPALVRKAAEELATYMPKAKRIVLSGMGDPFARPDTRQIMLDHTGKGPVIDLITNGLLMPRYWNDIKECRFGNLLVSVDAADRQTYEKIRRGGSWEDLLASLSLIRENRHRFQSVTLNMTVMRENANTIPAFIDLAESYGFDVSFQRIRGMHGDQNIFETNDADALQWLAGTVTREKNRKRRIAVYWGDLLEYAKAKDIAEDGVKGEVIVSGPPQLKAAASDGDFKVKVAELKKVNQQGNARECRGQSPVMKAGPLTAIVSVGSKCNLRCRMCHRTVHKTKGMNMPWSTFEKALEIFPTLQRVKLIGAGEPFLNRDYFKMLGVAKTFDLGTETVTNGTLLSDEVAKDIVLSGLDSLCISLDGATAETYESIRRGAKFQEVIEGIERINRYKNEYRSSTPVLGFSMVVMRRNIEELPAVIELASRLNLSWVTVLYMMVFSPDLVPESLFFHQDISDRMLSSTRERARQLGISVDMPGLFRDVPDAAQPGRRKKCFEPWQMAVIEAGGEVLPCCTYGIPMGNLNESDFYDIWNNEHYQDLRCRVNSQDPPEPCRHCSNSTVAHTVHDVRSHIRCAIPPDLEESIGKARQGFSSAATEPGPCRGGTPPPLPRAEHRRDGAADEFTRRQRMYATAQAHAREGRYGEAVRCLTDLLETFPDDAPACNDLGCLYYQLGDKTKALAFYEKAVELDPSNTTFLKNLADFYFVETGRLEDALKIYHGILAEHPDDVEALFAFGQVCVKLNRPEDAGPFFRKVLALEPGHETAGEMLKALERQTDEPSSEAAPFVSIVIPAGREPGPVSRLIGSIIHNSEYAGYEILVASSLAAGGAESNVMSSEKHNIRLTCVSSPGNAAAALNAAARKAGGNCLLFIDPRLVLSKGWLKPLLKTAEAHPGFGAVSPKIIDPPATIIEAGFSRPENGTVRGHGEGEAMDRPDLDYCREVPATSRFLTLLTKKTWEACGGFDERIEDFGLAMMDLGLSVRKTGKPAFYQPFAVAGLVQTNRDEAKERKQIVAGRDLVEKLRPRIVQQNGTGNGDLKEEKKRVLVLGVYMAGTLNTADDVAAVLSGAARYEVDQRWVALGGPAPTERLKALTVRTILEKTPKFRIMNELLSKEDLSRYEYVLMTDDDVVMPEGFLDAFVDLQDKLGFAIAQPARTVTSYVDHPIVIQQWGVLARETMFVEIGPVVSFHKSVHGFVFPFDTASPMGWGYENVWSYLVREKNMKMGIIDNTPVDHSIRKPVENYNWSEADAQRTGYLERHRHTPLAECFTILQVFNLEESDS